MKSKERSDSGRNEERGGRKRGKKRDRDPTPRKQERAEEEEGDGGVCYSVLLPFFLLFLTERR